MEKDLLEVPLDVVGKAAEKLMTLKESQGKLKVDMAAAEKNLIAALKKAKREHIMVKGKTLAIKITASKEKIVISK